MKKIIAILILLNGFVFSNTTDVVTSELVEDFNNFRPIKKEYRVTSELVERAEKDFLGYKEWLKEHDKKWLEAEKKWLENRKGKEGHKDYSRSHPRYNPDITYEEYREKGYLGNWLRAQVDFKKTVWADLIKVPQGTRMCGDGEPEYRGGIGGRKTWDLKSRLDYIERNSIGNKLLPDEWITPVVLKYINSACQLDINILSLERDFNKIKAEVERIEKINNGEVKNKNKDAEEMFTGLKYAFVLFIFFWFILFGFNGFKFWGKRKENVQVNSDNSLFNYMMYKFWFK